MHYLCLGQCNVFLRRRIGVQTLLNCAVALRFGNIYTFKLCNYAIDIVEDLACQFDEPMIDSSMIPTYMLSKEIKKFCTVALGGDGGDELFGGYHHHATSRLSVYSKANPRHGSSGGHGYLPGGIGISHFGQRRFRGGNANG